MYNLTKEWKTRLFKSLWKFLCWETKQKGELDGWMDEKEYKKQPGWKKMKTTLPQYFVLNTTNKDLLNFFLWTKKCFSLLSFPRRLCSQLCEGLSSFLSFFHSQWLIFYVFPSFLKLYSYPLPHVSNMTMRWIYAVVEYDDAFVLWQKKALKHFNLAFGLEHLWY